MYFNEFELDVLNRHRIDDLRSLAQASRRPKRQPRARIALAHALIAIANLVWRDEVAPAKPAVGTVAIS